MKNYWLVDIVRNEVLVPASETEIKEWEKNQKPFKRKFGMGIEILCRLEDRGPWKEGTVFKPSGKIGAPT